jgi:uncharacterized protein (DUF433 family)
MRFTKTLASATVAGVLGLAGVSVAGATSSGGSAQPSTTAAATASGASGTSGATGAKAGATARPGARKAARAVRRRRLRRAGALAAKTIGISPAELVQQLRAGKTIAEIASDHGVTAQTVISALQDAATAKIEAAKTADKITAERAARLETRAAKVIPKLVNNWHLRKPAAG